MKISELKLKETFWMMFENAPKQFLVIDITMNHKESPRVSTVGVCQLKK